MSKTQWSSNVLFVALILPVAKPTTRTRSPCAMNSGGSGYEVSTVSLAFWSTSANPACPRCVPASVQPSPGMIHSISSADNASRACISPLRIAAKKSFTIWTFSCVLIAISPFPANQLDSVIERLLPPARDENVMNLKTIHTTRNGNLITRNPRCVIGSKKYGSFRNIFGLTSTTKRCIGNKHFFILTASSDARTTGTFCFRSAWQNRIDTNVLCTQFFRQSNRYGV